MFESAEIGHKTPKDEYRKLAPKLRSQLLEAQYEMLQRASFSVVVLINGVDGSGKGETVNVLNEWMDPRHIRTEAFGARTEPERLRPEMWRFWQVLPAKGRIGIFFGSWYTDPILARVMGHEKKSKFDRRLEQIRHFEQMLAAEDVVIVKFWFHLTKKGMRKRFRELEGDPNNSWRVTHAEWDHLKSYDEFIDVDQEALRLTSTGEAPWWVVDGSDANYRELTVGQYLLDAIKRRLAGEEAPVREPPRLARPALDGRTLMASFDYTRKLGEKAYDRKLEELQGRVARLARDKRMAGRSLILVFEGMDAAGKGSTIRRITTALDARFYRVVPIAAPSDEEKAQPYLWRFWRHVPQHGHAVIYDRSWYGRVLVERVEGFCAEDDWMRAYSEINEFESQLVEGGAVLVKFWLSITQEQQLARFKEREATPYKNYKITAEDWRNREKWPLYERAVGDMVDRTSTDIAPWHVIASDDKLWSRIEVLRTVCEALEQGLEKAGGK
ncbi:MAG TPA: polyphosphate:AMP phosphotransferase [Ramlibacter sp.]|uniref:polyphosphate:AMP phosphotransferase n=1 Tax=Ramlibacter sp. TaxID=1917967 RepID=UPI002CBB8709|nr:polyphosphate:AMP phosphotransferase [Ramlibacter sp.]HVZ42781.1 polyphosphate:AMP phosphotransferase [Ramlibacter sp.]